MKRDRGIHRLRAKGLDALPEGEHQDGGGLLLRVEAAGSCRWVQRLTLNGRRINRGLGPYPLITLDMARDQSLNFKRAAREGKDLAREKRLADAKATTFRQAFEAFFENKAKELKYRRHLLQWPFTMNRHHAGRRA
jgi:Arm DNA-binding domain